MRCSTCFIIPLCDFANLYDTELHEQPLRPNQLSCYKPAMPLDCTIDSAALLKILLHAAKYPASPINGLLIGRADAVASGSDKSSDHSGGSLDIIDAVPLFHSCLHLSMPLETALVQVGA